ncbi:hypothetical protein [Pseudomonas sp. USHLN015]|uniref:hypothetical protein n=1 Tax=Pseudomonas sp. USHLN015 TaxID=3081296 RepID=UPI00301DA023
MSTELHVESLVLRGARNEALTPDLNLHLDDPRLSLGELIRRVVLHQVAERTVTGWLDRLQASGPSDYLSDDDIRRQSARGAIKLRTEVPDAPRIDAEAEVQRALDGFRQRRYRILLDGRMLNDLDHSLDLPAQARLTFLRLVPLVGG